MQQTQQTTAPVQNSFWAGFHDGVPIGLGYPLGWLLCAIMQTIYYLKSGWEKKQANVT